MRRKVLSYVLGFILVLATITGAMARFERTFDMNQNVFEIEAYVCTNSDCSQVTDYTYAQRFPNGTRTTTGEITIGFPTGQQPQYGYAVYLFAEGFLAKAYRFRGESRGGTIYEGSDFKRDVWSDTTFNKIANCKARVDTLHVQNSVMQNQPVIVNMALSADGQVQSAFMTPPTHPVQYIPEGRKANWYSSDVRVTMQVFNENGFQQGNDQVIDFSNAPGARPSLYQGGSSESFSFTYTPSQTGQHDLIVTTTVTDNQCSSTSPQETARGFFVHEGPAVNKIFTEVNDLRVLEERPLVGETLHARYTKRSNFANNVQPGDVGYVQTPVWTNVTHRVYNGSDALIWSENRLLPANSEPTGFVEFEFTFVPPTSGQYRFEVEATGVLPDGVSPVPNDVSKAKVDVFVRSEGQQFVILGFNDAASRQGISFVNVTIADQTRVSDAFGRVVMGPFALGVYDFLAVHPQYAPVTGQVVVEEFQRSFSFLMNFVGGNPPTPPAGAVNPPVQEVRKRASTQFSRTEIPNAFDLMPGDSVDVFVNLRNNGDIELEESKIIVSIPELGLRRAAGPFDLRAGDSSLQRVSLELPYDLAPGTYYVKINFYTEGHDNTIWREIYVH